MSEITPDPVIEDEDRQHLVYQDLIFRTCIAEIVEETDEVYFLKAPAWLNHQLVPQQDPKTGQPIADPRSDPKAPKPLLGIHTVWVPFMYVESLEDREAGYVIEVPKTSIKEYGGIRPALIETYRINVMGIGKPEEPPIPGAEEEPAVNLFGGAE